MSQIQTAEIVHAARIAQLGLHGRAAELVLAMPDKGGLWDNPRVPPPRSVPSGVAVGGAIPAFVNHGRWIVLCACASAQVASRLDPRFFCSNCQNAPVGGLWRAVTFPPDADAIEAILSRRPNDDNRNWMAGETQADLLAENKREGVK